MFHVSFDFGRGYVAFHSLFPFPVCLGNLILRLWTYEIADEKKNLCPGGWGGVGCWA